MAARKVDAFDIIIGRNIRTIRKDRGYTLEEIASLLDITMQQLSKYELGRNRICARNLQHLAFVFGVDINTFFKINR
jgi:transcriptional regulator with XRE-family HTH domain